MSKKFDVDKFIDELELEALEGFDEEARFRECPKCGSDTWDELFYSKAGRIKNCTDCRDEHEQ